ncbi:MAG: hypothetical protein FJ030_06570 [Chloroflexi bacterium]|nr:hypothetical protein [Chloroflexota bacterium]
MTERIGASDLLRDTAYFVSLARRAALTSDDPAVREKAMRLGPVARELKEIANGQPRDLAAAPAPVAAPKPSANAPVPPAAAASDFRTLIDAAAQKREPAAALRSDSLDRTTVALSMAQGGANGIEIAKSLGMTRGEVDLILSIARQK